MMTTRYRYRAAEANGRVARGTLDAASLTEAGTLLLLRGLQPIDVVATAPGMARSTAPKQQLALVFRSLASLREAGVPLERAVRCTLPLTSGRLRETLEQALSHLSAGRMLADSLDDGGGMLPQLVSGMLRAGERAGQLTQALTRVAEQLEHEAEFQARLRQALAYPMLLVVAGIASIGVITGVVIPRFSLLLAEFGQELPPLTQALLGMSALMQRWWPVLLGGLAAVALLVWQRWQSIEGRRAIHAALLSLPVLGPLRHSLSSARVLRAFSSALLAGIPLLSALRAAGEASGDSEVLARLDRSAVLVAEGQPASAALSSTRALTGLATDLLAVGEGTGQLGAMAARAATLLSTDAERRLQTMVRLLEPGLVVLFGGLTTFVAAALLQAVYSIRPGGS
jgi:general secretion pathway protein F